MIAHLTDLLGALRGPWLYVVVGVFAAAESAALVGLLLPGETAVVLGGVAVGLGHADLAAMLVVAGAGAVLGDQIGYGVGRLFSRSLRRGRLGQAIGAARWARAETFLVERGGVAVFAARWVGFLRAVVPAAAGAVGMPQRIFLVWNTLGGLLWSATVVLIGVLAGRSWMTVAHWFGTGAAVAGAVGLATVVGAAWLRRRARGDREDVLS